MLDFSELSALFTHHGMSRKTARQSLNYVWLSDPLKRTVSEGEVLCALPPRYLDRVIENAEKYPNAQVQIWIDKKKMDATSQFFIASHIHISDQTNIRIRDLNDIGSYGAIPIRPSNIWGLVDTVRLQMLLHEARHGNADQIFYADFDIWDVKLQDRHVQNCMRDKGLILGRAHRIFRNDILENGYFGLRRDIAESFLAGRDGLINDTARDAIRGLNGFYAYNRAVLKMTNPFDPHCMKDISIKVMQPTGYTLPRNRFYESLGLESGPIPRG